MNAQLRQWLRLAIFLGFFGLSFALYFAAAAGQPWGMQALLAGLICLMLLAVLVG